MSSKKDDKPEITAEGSLSPQFGSDPETLMRDQLDVLRLTKFGKLAKYWIPYFMNIPAERGGKFAKQFCLGYMNASMSEEGWNKNKMIQQTAAAKGAPSVGELVRKPNVLVRNLTDRHWKEKAEEKGQMVVE